jgi:hypothetical protein
VWCFHYACMSVVASRMGVPRPCSAEIEPSYSAGRKRMLRMGWVDLQTIS